LATVATLWIWAMATDAVASPLRSTAVVIGMG
jgi:hypothetical protein